MAQKVPQVTISTNIVMILSWAISIFSYFFFKTTQGQSTVLFKGFGCTSVFVILCEGEYYHFHAGWIMWRCYFYFHVCWETIDLIAVHVSPWVKGGWDYFQMLCKRHYGTGQLPFRKRKYDRVIEAGEMKILMLVSETTLTWSRRQQRTSLRKK